MHIRRLSINNLRCIDSLVLDLDEDSVFLIGENGTGKTTVLEAIARAFGRVRSTTKRDFRDLAEPVEVQAELVGLSTEQQAAFSDEIDFSGPVTLTIGFRAIWDVDAETVELTHGFPTHDWRKTKPQQRDTLLLESLPEGRDVGSMLQLSQRWSLMGRLVQELGLDQSVDEAARGIEDVRQKLASDPAIRNLLKAARNALASIVPQISEDVFSLGGTDATTQDTLRHLELLLAHLGEPVAVARQSSGLGHLAAFAFAIQLVRKQSTSVMLIDEPEASLHPQAQRALMTTLGQLDCQTVIATHSSNLLDRADPRRIVRIFRDPAGAARIARAALDEEEARKFTRFSNPQTAEAFFAQGVVLLEGDSDKLAMEAATAKLSKNLDGEGITLVTLQGGGGLRAFLSMLGPRGFALRLAGLCDADHEEEWSNLLQDAGVVKGAGRSAMEASGFFVCDVDLEDELLRALGPKKAVEIIHAQGDGSTFKHFAGQPTQKSKSIEEQLRAFLATSRRKVRYAPLLVDHLDVSKLPGPIRGALSSV